MSKERRSNRRHAGKLGRVPFAGKEASEEKADAWCVESQVYFLGPAVLEIPPHAHSLDVMHVMKNICESPLATIVNMLDRTKDGPKARHDLGLLGIKKELHGPPNNDDDDDATMDEDTQGCHKRAKRREWCFPLPASL
jgi:hypothetical protein